MGMPRLDNETFEAIYAPQGKQNESPDVPDAPTTKPHNNQGLPSTADGSVIPDDNADNDFEQSDMAYTGG